MKRLIGGLMIAFAVTVASPAFAAPEDIANRISTEVMSPFCPGVTLHECPSGQATDLRERIESWAAQGWSEARIMDELTAEYGEGIRATPPTDGGGIAAWLLPGLLAAGGLVFAGTLARRWTLRRESEIGSEVSSLAALGPAQLERLNRELAAQEARLQSDSGGLS